MYDVHAFDATSLGDVDRDAALTFVLDFVRASAARIVKAPADGDFGEVWEQSVESLTAYVGEEFPLAGAVGRAAGEAMGSPYDAERAWGFGLDRVIAGLAELIDPDQA
jgi:hypothetical protein